MQFYIMTLFPDMVMDGLNTSIIGRAMDKGLLDIEAVNIRDYAKQVDIEGGTMQVHLLDGLRDLNSRREEA